MNHVARGAGNLPAGPDHWRPIAIGAPRLHHGAGANRMSRKVLPNFARERAAYVKGIGLVAGADEAGVAPWAGPVVAAAVILDPACVPKGVDDSKKLTAARREELFAEICACAEVAIAFAPPARIDRINILRASQWALAQAVRGLSRRPALVLVDGPHRPPIDLPCEVRPIVDGDARSASIAAASIVAKVTRDQLMRRLGLAFPDYGFEQHKGYGTELHVAALKKHGPCCHHRLSFTPVIEAHLKLAVV
jgi:ribonuclease HII